MGQRSVLTQLAARLRARRAQGGGDDDGDEIVMLNDNCLVSSLLSWALLPPSTGTFGISQVERVLTASRSCDYPQETYMAV